MLDFTHAPEAQSWVSSANAADIDFPIQNLPFGRFRRAGTNETPRLDSSNAVASPAMPPPTIATSIRRSHLAANEVFEQRDDDR